MAPQRKSRRVQENQKRKAAAAASKAAARRQIRNEKKKRKKSSGVTPSDKKSTTASTNGQRSSPATSKGPTIIRNPYARKKANPPPSPVSDSEESLPSADLSTASLPCPSESESEFEFDNDEDNNTTIDGNTTTIEEDPPLPSKKRRLNPSDNLPAEPTTTANPPSTMANHPSTEANPNTSTEANPNTSTTTNPSTNPSATSFLPDFDYTPTAEAAIPRLVSNKDGSIDFSTAADLAPKETSTTTDPSGFSLASILQTIHENPIRVGPDAVQVTIDNLSTNTPAHEKKLLTVEKEFFETLANHDQACGLAEKIPDPEDPSSMKFRLYIECRAPIAPKKHYILNWALMIYSVSHRKKKYRGMDLSKNTALFAEAQYEPNTVDLFFKCLFSRFHSESIPYKLSRDFNGKGQLMAYWNYIFKITKEERRDYGTNPMKSQFDVNFQEKWWKAANDPKNPFNPLSNVNHYVWCALANVMYHNNTRGCQEPTSIKMEDFSIGIGTEGDYAGIPYVQLSANYDNQKGVTLTMKKNVVNAENSKKKCLPIPFDSHPLSCYKTIRTLMEWMPDADTCTETKSAGRRFFRHKASTKDLLKFKQRGMPWKLSPNKKNVIGPNNVNVILKKMAKWCGYDNWERCTSHGLRRGGLSTCANAGVSSAVMVQLGGHSAVPREQKMTALYQKPNQQAYDQAIRAKHGSPTAIKEKLAEASKLATTESSKKFFADDDPNPDDFDLDDIFAGINDYDFTTTDDKEDKKPSFGFDLDKKPAAVDTKPPPIAPELPTLDAPSEELALCDRTNTPDKVYTKHVERKLPMPYKPTPHYGHQLKLVREQMAELKVKEQQLQQQQQHHYRHEQLDFSTPAAQAHYAANRVTQSEAPQFAIRRNTGVSVSFVQQPPQQQQQPRILFTGTTTTEQVPYQVQSFQPPPDHVQNYQTPAMMAVQPPTVVQQPVQPPTVVQQQFVQQPQYVHHQQQPTVVQSFGPPQGAPTTTIVQQQQPPPYFGQQSQIRWI